MLWFGTPWSWYPIFPQCRYCASRGKVATFLFGVIVAFRVLLPSLPPPRPPRPPCLLHPSCPPRRLPLAAAVLLFTLVVFVELSMSVAPTASAIVRSLYCCGICCCGLAVEGRVEFEFEIMQEILGYGPCNSSSAPARLQFQAPQ